MTYVIIATGCLKVNGNVIYDITTDSIESVLNRLDIDPSSKDEYIDCYGNTEFKVVEVLINEETYNNLFDPSYECDKVEKKLLFILKEDYTIYDIWKYYIHDCRVMRCTIEC